MITTTDELVAKIRVKGRIPDSSPDYTAAVILSEADDVISERLVEVISSLRQGLLVTISDVATVAGQQSYDLPTLAAGGALEGVSILQSDGTERPLHRFDSSDIQWITGSSQGKAESYIVVGDSVILSRPPSDTAETVRFRYTQRRSKLVPTSECAALSGIDGGADTITVLTADIPSTLSGFGPFELTDYQLPYRKYWTDVTMDSSAVVGPFTTFGSTTTDLTPTGVYTYDWLSKAGETCVIPIPPELHTALANGTASAILAQMGFKEEAATCYSMMERGIAAYKALAAPRVKNAPIKLVNRLSPLRLRR